jgi:hypothetical protein
LDYLRGCYFYCFIGYFGLVGYFVAAVSIILGVALVRGFWERLGLVEGRGFIALLMAILVWVRLSMGTFSWCGHARV